jgi:hypothetical protein
LGGRHTIGCVSIGLSFFKEKDNIPFVRIVEKKVLYYEESPFKIDDFSIYQVTVKWIL